MREKILNKQVKVSKADMHRLARANYDARAQTLQEILHPELKVEPKPDADSIIREPGKAPVLPFQKIESVYDSDAYPEEVRHDYVALEHVTTRFRTEFDYFLRTMPDTAQREVILKSSTSTRSTLLRWNLRSQRMSRQHNNRHIVCCQQKSKGVCV